MFVGLKKKKGTGGGGEVERDRGVFCLKQISVEKNV